MHERRKSVRTRVQRSVKLLLAELQVTDCFVVDLTNAGAGIQISNTASLPETFWLTFDLGRSKRSSQLIWRSRDRMGVKFL